MADNKTHAWDFRPTALYNDYVNASGSSLMKHFIQDNHRAAKSDGSGLEIPPKPSAGRGHVFLRTCQWNIHYLAAPWLRGDGGRMKHASRVADAILDVNPDVVVLNEFGFNGRHGGMDVNALATRLELAGHTLNEADCFCPTAIATRLPIRDFGRFSLDGERAAVHVTVDVQPEHENDEGFTGTNVTVYGTHLDCSDYMLGENRLAEANRLLEKIQEKPWHPEDSILIAGDFNQQRRCDYSKEEWKNVCENKAIRSSPRGDGVAKRLQKAGFSCCFDQKNVARKNWTGQHPPSTHWSGTTIDYTYSKGRNISLVGMYVLPHNLSDHRMVVCDWKITPRKGK